MVPLRENGLWNHQEEMIKRPTKIKKHIIKEINQLVYFLGYA
jgi:hypothetical protein